MFLSIEQILTEIMCVKRLVNIIYFWKLLYTKLQYLSRHQSKVVSRITAGVERGEGVYSYFNRFNFFFLEKDGQLNGWIMFHGQIGNSVFFLIKFESDRLRTLICTSSRQTVVLWTDRRASEVAISDYMYKL